MQKDAQLWEAIERLQARNMRVESAKAWETSGTRKVSITILTYLVIVLVMVQVEIDRPWINAIIPSLGFWLSTLSLRIVRHWWLGHRRS